MYQKGRPQSSGIQKHPVIEGHGSGFSAKKSGTESDAFIETGRFAAEGQSRDIPESGGARSIRPDPKPPIRAPKAPKPLRHAAARPAGRRWTCAHCPHKNEAGQKKCAACGIRRATKRTSLKSRCDRIAAKIVKDRAGGKCERCHAVAPLDWAHIFVRAKHNSRWDPENALALCRPCHDYTGNHPATFMAWLADWKGRDWLEALERKSNERWNRSYPDVFASLLLEAA